MPTQQLMLMRKTSMGGAHECGDRNKDEDMHTAGDEDEQHEDVQRDAVLDDH